jgi:tetratricopeptide (TPR) repeat protein
MKRHVAAVALVLAFTGCTLYNEVSVTPLRIAPSSVERGTDLPSMIRKADYLRAIEFASRADARTRRTAVDVGAIGSAYLAAGRFDAARARLREALDMQPYRTAYADIAWNLSQVEYLANNFDASLDWAQIAASHGLQIRQWHLDYLKSLSNIPVYSFSGRNSERVLFRFGRPDVPRIATRVNHEHRVEAIIDSGAVLSIVSQRLASRLNIRRLGTFEGTFYGLLGEPINVQFGMLDRLELGDMIVDNVPVAIMPDAKMRFLVSKRDKQEMRIDLLLGSNLLKEFRLELDFDRRAVTFTRLTPADRRPAADQNLFYDGFRPHVRGAINGKAWYLFILDTGSEITFLNQSRLDMLPIRIFGGGAHTATLQGLGGSMKRGAKLINVEVGVDEWAGTFKTIPMYESDDREQSVGIIGQNFLGRFNVVIDFGRMRVDLKRR